MTRIAMRDLGDEYARIFGTREEPDAPGRSRLCKVCGGWHSLSRPWPHNCRSEAPPRADFPAPQIAPTFQPFMTGRMDTAEYIGDRRDKREFMERNDLVEYDEGVGDHAQWVEDREYEREVVSDIKRFVETDPINYPQVERINETNLEEAPEVSTEGMEVVT